MVKCLIQGIVFLVVVSITELALSQTCAQSTSTINAYLKGFQKFQTSTVAYAWTGAHYSGGAWTDRKNPNDSIAFNLTGALVSQNFSSVFSHGASGNDASSASASAQCAGANCGTPTLATSACVTSKVDSAGAGAYARAGVTAPAQSKTAKRSTVTIDIPNRMTLYSNVGNESGVWGIAVSVEKVEGQKSLVDKGHPDVTPFLVDLLGLKDEKQFKVYSDKQRHAMFVAGFELDPQGNKVKLIGPDGAGWMNLQADQPSIANATLNALMSLRKRFVMLPCKTVGEAGMVQINEKCHTAEYRLGNQENISIEAPYEFPDEPEMSKSEQILYIEVGQGGRDDVQTKGAIDLGPANE